MDYNNLFLDSDVILDLLFERKPYSLFTEVLFEECPKQQIYLKTSALVIANIHYIATKKLGRSLVRERLKNLIKKIGVLSFEINAIDFALNSAFTDFEDAIQHFIATENNCDLIITRNIKDYKHSSIPVLTAEQYLRTIL